MRKLTLLLLLLCSIGMVFADYYDNVINLNGNQLYTALRTLISTNTNSNYTDAKEQFFGYFDNNNGLVRCVYTGQDWSVPVGGMPNQNLFNCEHTYAQSWFTPTQSSIKKADIHHLFPTNAQVNSSRGNLPFDNLQSYQGATTYVSYNGYHSYRGYNAQNIQVFEPAGQHKGNLARSLLYFNVRYNDTLTQAGVNMIPILLQWHILDPVDNAEINRNQDIYEYQNNRNPFVDHPEFVQRIWGPTSNEDDTIVPHATIQVFNPYPNPFNESILMGFNTKGVPAQVQVYDVRGRLLKTISVSPSGNNDQYINWNGEDETGAEVTNGVYLLRVSTGTSAVTKRVLKSK